MSTNIVVTFTGKDRVGLVDQVTQMLLDRDGNIEASRMAHLGGEFAMLMLVTLPAEQFANLERDAAQWDKQGYKVTLTHTAEAHTHAPANTLPFHIEVQGADHEGIVHEVAHYLAQRGINIEEMTTATNPAPITGQPLFSMNALVAVPANMANEWETALDQLAQHLNVDIHATPEKR